MSEKRADVVAWVEMLRPEDYPMTPMPDVASRDLDTETLEDRYTIELLRVQAETMILALGDRMRIDRDTINSGRYAPRIVAEAQERLDLCMAMSIELKARLAK